MFYFHFARQYNLYERTARTGQPDCLNATATEVGRLTDFPYDLPAHHIADVYR